MRTFCRMLLTPLLGDDPGVADAEMVSCGRFGAGRVLGMDPGGPVTGVAAPAPAVGSALRAATGLAGDAETETPDPGEIWLVEVSRLVLDGPWLSSMSLSRATTCLELP